MRLVAGVWWFVVGAAFGFGVVGMLTIGPPLVLLGVIMTVIGLKVHRFHGRSTWLVLVGAATAPLMLAWLNRSGPGMVCTTRGDVSGCTQEWSPWPFLVVGLLMIAAGLLITRQVGIRRGPR